MRGHQDVPGFIGLKLLQNEWGEKEGQEKTWR